jgi:tetratricopeptide (TPR) repeat protein
MSDEIRYEDSMRRMDREQFVRLMKEAVAHLQEGDGAAAIPILERLAQLYPDDIGVAINLGGAYILTKQWALAVELLEIASQYDPGNPAIWSNLAAAYLGTLEVSTPENQMKAIVAYERAVELNPTYPNAHYNLGLIYIDQGEWVKAQQMFDRAIRVNPLDRDARKMLARAEELIREDSLKGLNGISTSQPPSNPSLN